MFRPWYRGRDNRCARCPSLSTLDAKVDLHPFLVLLKDRIILAQRMALPSVWQQNALQVGMPIELDAEHVEDFALQPVGCLPNFHRGAKMLAVFDLRLYPHALVVVERVQDVNDV